MPPHSSAPSAERAYAWLGGAAFVASLGYFLYVFMVRFGRSSPTPASSAGLMRPLVLDAALFGLFAAHHSLMARTGAKRWLERRLPPHLERATYVWFSSVLFVLCCWLWQDVPGMLYAHQGAALLLHDAAQAAGFWFVADATAVLDPLDLAGIHQAERRAVVPSLRIVGLYRWVRHPVYLGWILITFGPARMTGNRAAFAAISAAYLLLAIPWEERSLIETFGERYREYRRTVRWRVIPLLY